MKVLFALLLGVITAFSGGTLLVDSLENGGNPAVGAALRVFVSSQLAPDPIDGYILSTNGATSSWIANTSGQPGLHVDGGGFVYPQDGDYHSAPYYVATSTTATSTFVDIAASGRAFFSDIVGTMLDITGINSLLFDKLSSSPSHQEGLLFYDGTNDVFKAYNAESDVALDIGEEMWVFVRNETGSTITNGQAVYISGASTGVPTITLADASLAATSDRVIGLATHDIENNTSGYVTTFGVVRDVDTSSFSDGDPLYLSTTSGQLQNTPPDFPNYTIRLGEVGLSSSTAGTIIVNRSGTANDIIHNFQNGSVLQSIDFIATSTDGVTVTGQLQAQGGGDLTVLFSDGFHEIDTTPATTTTLTAGSDTVPVQNFLYIPSDTNSLTVSTAGFPSSGEYAPIATVVVQSASSLQTNGAYKVHLWTDHISGENNNGHMSHINEWIRNQNATYLDGVDLTLDPTVGGGTNSFIDVQTTSGNVLQLHPHSYPAYSTTTENIYIVNEPTTPYTQMAGLVRSTLTQDSTGATLSNRRYPVVLYGIVSQDDADSKLFLNLPSCSYGLDDAAIQDADNCADDSIPGEYKGTAFLIAAVTLRDRSSLGGSLEVLSIKDLRGTFPGTISGGGGGVASTEFSDAQFTLFNNADNTKQGEFDLSGITTSITRTLTWPDANGTIALTSDFLWTDAGPNIHPTTASDAVSVGTTTVSDLSSLTVSATSTDTGAIVTLLDDDGTVRAVFEDGGNVGIGTSTPERELHVVSDAAGRTTLLVENTNDTNATLNLKNSFGEWSMRSNTVGAFALNNATAFTIPFTILQSNDHVGIDDTSPAYRFTVGNGDLFGINDSGIALAPTGAASTPSYSFTADTNTGMYRSAADELNLVTAGSDRLTIDVSGNIGISTSTPDTIFEIYEPDAENTRMRLTGNGGDSYWEYVYRTQSDEGFAINYGAMAGAEMLLSKDGDLRITGGITSASTTAISYLLGDVGIGTSNPTSLLELGSGYLQIDTTTSAPASADCDAVGEEGRMIFDATNDLLYICSGASGWVSK